MAGARQYSGGSQPVAARPLDITERHIGFGGERRWEERRQRTPDHCLIFGQQHANHDPQCLMPYIPNDNRAFVDRQRDEEPESAAREWPRIALAAMGSSTFRKTNEAIATILVPLRHSFHRRIFRH